jgi:hypothetical protein
MIVGRLFATLSRYSSTVAATASSAQTWASFAADAVGQLRATQEALPSLLPALRRRVALYMGSGVTAGILFKPVYDSCAQAVSALVHRAVELHQAATADATAGSDGGDTAAAASSLDMRGQIDAGCAAVSRALELSEELSADVTNAAFGYDDHILRGIPTA